MHAAPKITSEKTFKLDGASPDAVAWSPDGKLLATADTLNRRIIIWDYATQTKLHSLYKAYFGGDSLAFTADGRFLVTSAVSPKGNDNRKSLSVIDVATGAVVSDIDGPDEHPNHIAINVSQKFTVSPSGKYLASVTERHGGGGEISRDTLTVYNQTDFSLIYTRDIHLGTASLSFSPSNQFLAIIDVSGGLTVWEPATGRKVTELTAHPGSGRCGRVQS